MSYYFKKISIDDIEFLNEVRNGYASEYLHDTRKFTLYESIEWFNKNNPDYWIIFLDDLRIGYFRLTNYSDKERSIYIGADIHKNYTNKGHGYLVYKLFMDKLFNERNLDKIKLEVLSTNERALHLYEKIGFSIIGIKNKYMIKHENYVDSIIMQINKKDLNKKC